MKFNDIDPNNTLDPQKMENIFNVYTDDDSYYYYNLLKSVYFPEDLDPTYYTTYTVVPKDTWPLISWKNYQTTNLWWLLCAVNQIINPTEPLEPGTILRILNVDVVRNVMVEINQ